MTSDEILGLFRSTHALLDGHFVLRSGLHSRQFFQCALLLQHPQIAARVCGALAEKLGAVDAECVISPALGGILVGHEIARARGKPHIFVEKDNGVLALRRGFEIPPGSRFIVAEDVVTRGGRVQETIDIVRAHGGEVAAVAALVDRSGGKLPDFGCAFIALLQLEVETFSPNQLPPDLASTPAVKAGSK